MWRNEKEMKAKKDNKIYRITTEQEKQRYLKEGFDIYDDNGKLLEYSPMKKIKYSEYEKVRKELESAKAENELLKRKVEDLETDGKDKSSGKAGK